MSARRRQHHQGFTLVEVLTSLAVASVLIVGVISTTSQVSRLEQQASTAFALQQQLNFALQRMTSATNASSQLLLPLHDRPTSAYTEHDRHQFVPAQAPPAGTSLATAVLAVAQDPTIDLDNNGVPDADNDGDGRIDEDWPRDTTNDGAPGIVLIDDDGDGEVDEGFFSDHDDDELLGLSEDRLNQIDDDDDGSVDEDPSADMNGDGEPGVEGVDDDGDGNIDEGNRDDDDEDGQEDEDWIDARVFHLVGSNLVERQPVPWDANGDGNQDGADYVESVILENVTEYRVQLTSDAYAAAQVVRVSLSISDAQGQTLADTRELVVRERR